MSARWDFDTTRSEPLSIEDVLALYEKILKDQRHPHGSEQRPHIVNPRWPHRCIECGAEDPSFVYSKEG